MKAYAYPRLKLNSVYLAISAALGIFPLTAQAEICTGSFPTGKTCSSTALPNTSAEINATGNVTRSVTSGNTIGLYALSNTATSTLSKVAHQNGTIRIDISNATSTANDTGAAIRTAQSVTAAPVPNTAGTIEALGSNINVTAQGTGIRWLFGIEATSSGISPTSVIYQGNLTVNNQAATSFYSTRGIKSTPSGNLADAFITVKANSNIAVQSIPNASGLDATAKGGGNATINVEAGSVVNVGDIASVSNPLLSIGLDAAAPNGGTAKQVFDGQAVNVISNNGVEAIGIRSVGGVANSEVQGNITTVLNGTAPASTPTTTPRHVYGIESRGESSAIVNQHDGSVSVTSSSPKLNRAYGILAWGPSTSPKVEVTTRTSAVQLDMSSLALADMPSGGAAGIGMMTSAAGADAIVADIQSVVDVAGPGAVGISAISSYASNANATVAVNFKNAGSVTTTNGDGLRLSASSGTVSAAYSEGTIKVGKGALAGAGLIADGMAITDGNNGANSKVNANVTVGDALNPAVLDASRAVNGLSVAAGGQSVINIQPSATIQGGTGAGVALSAQVATAMNSLTNQGGIQSYNSLALLSTSIAGVSSTILNDISGSITGYMTYGAGNDTVNNLGAWRIEKCTGAANCQVATTDFGAGSNTLNSSGTITVTNSSLPGTSNHALIQATGASAFSMINSGMINMQDSLLNGLLTVKPVGSGSFVTNGGTLKLDTQVAGDFAPSDILQVDGSITANSPTAINITDAGGPPALTSSPNGGIPLVKYTGTSAANAFTMADFVKGEFTYRLRHDTINKMWKLVNLRCTASKNPAYEAETVSITCEGVEPGEKITIPGTNCQQAVASSDTITCTASKAKDIGPNPTISIFDAAGNPRSSPDAALSIYAATLAISVNNQIADGNAYNIVTATAKDTSGNLVAGATVNFTVGSGATLVNSSCVTDASGQCSVKVKSTIAGSYPVTASVNGVPLPSGSQNVTFVAGPAVAAQSSIAVTQNNEAADGSAKNTVTATAKDASGNPVAGATVNFTVGSGATLVNSSCVTDASGQCSVKVKSTTAGSYPVTALMNGTPLSGPVMVSFLAAQPIPALDKLGQLLLVIFMMLGGKLFLQRKKVS